MLSAFIPSRLSYPAVLLAEQLVHQRSVHPGPLVLRTAPLRYPTPTPDTWKTTKDLLYKSDIPTTTGYSTQVQNIGQVSNRGVELSIKTENENNNFYPL